MVCVLSIAGDHVPVIPSFDVPDKVKLSPEQTGGCWVKVGVTGVEEEPTTMVSTTGGVHDPASSTVTS